MLLQTRSRSSSPVRGSSSSAAGRSSSPQEKLVALPHKYYARAAVRGRAGKILGPTAWHSPLSRRACVRAALREAADAELQNAPAPVWAPGRKFYHVKDHKTDSRCSAVSEDVVSPEVIRNPNMSRVLLHTMDHRARWS